MVHPELSVVLRRFLVVDNKLNHFLLLPAQEKGAGVGWKIGLVTVALGIPTILIIGICSLILGWGVGE